MKSTLDCIPCLTRLALNTARQVTDDGQVHEQVLREATAALSGANWDAPAPLMARPLFEAVCRAVGDPDPLSALRARDNRLALDIVDELHERIRHSDSPLGTALRISAAGNAIDFATCGEIGSSELTRSIEQALGAPFEREIATFERALRDADDVLFLADNAGEIVFDALLLHQLPAERITVAVRGGPSLNDAQRSDAEMAGLPERCVIIDNGSNVPGTVLEDCSDAFVRRFRSADLVIAKGQGNYETLSDVDANVLFLLKIKCAVVAELLGCTQGEIALRWVGADSEDLRR